MTSSLYVEAFAHHCTFREMPPSLAWVDAELHRAFPPPARILQWAIVKSDPASGELWIEGCLTGSAN